jgi:hypothetical protein
MSEPRRPGRPAIADDDSSTSVHVRLPSRQYDDLYQRAQQERINVPDLIRQSLAATFPKKPD